jgi:CspA family cold shock protein
MDNTKILGKVRWFDSRRGYGFIIGPQQQDIFAHFSHIQMEGYKTLSKGQEVKYDLKDTELGPQAHNIEIVQE